MDFLLIVILRYFWIGIDVDFTNAESYPERPDEPDCIYYLRTGFCGYGARCRFNHPQDRSLVILTSPIVYLSFCICHSLIEGFDECSERSV